MEIQKLINFKCFRHIFVTCLMILLLRKLDLSGEKVMVIVVQGSKIIKVVRHGVKLVE
jgi:hypothetical protein